MNSQLPRFTAHTPLKGRRGKKKKQLEDKVCINVRAEEGSAGTSLLTSCFCSCSLVARLVWGQPRSPEQSQSQEFAHPGAAQGGTNRNTTAAPLLSFPVTFITLFFPSFFNVLTIYISYSRAQSPCEGSHRPCPNSDQGWKFSRVRDPLWQLSLRIGH